MVHFNLGKYKKFVPFIDVKFGYGINSDRAMYCTPSLGLRFAHGEKHAYYLALQFIADAWVAMAIMIMEYKLGALSLNTNFDSHFSLILDYILSGKRKDLFQAAI